MTQRSMLEQIRSRGYSADIVKIQAGWRVVVDGVVRFDAPYRSQAIARAFDALIGGAR